MNYYSSDNQPARDHHFGGSERLPRLYPYVIAVLVALLVLMLGGGIYRLDISSSELTKDINRIYYGNQNILPHRGSISDKNGIPLAINTNEYSVYAHLNSLRGDNRAFELSRCYLANGGQAADIIDTRIKSEIVKACTGDGAAAAVLFAKTAAVLKPLAAVFDMPAATMLKKMSSDRAFIMLKKKASPQMIEQLRQIRQKHRQRFKLSGLQWDYRSQRFYPKKEYFAHLVGYIDYQGEGKSGIEGWRQESLLAHPGETTYLRTSRGEVLRELYVKPARSGVDLRLSVDSRLQYYAYEALAESVRRLAAKSASAIVMDARSGGILALANYPSFNPNNIQRVDERLQNYALSHAVEPGSTVKPFVAAMALADGKVDAHEVFPTKRALQIGKQTIRDSHIREDLDLTGIIAKSSNVGAVLLAERLGKKRLWEGYQQLGFGGDKLLALAGETQGALRYYRHWRRNDFSTHAYGYGFSVSLLRLLSAYSVFATDGVVLHPVLEADGRASGQRVLAADIARRVRRMMEVTVSENGTAAAAKIAGYRVAGKTGTTYKWHNGQYDDKKRRAFFVGMAPASKPAYVIAIMVNEPNKNGQTGGSAAAPIFAKIMRRALLLGGVAPDDEEFLAARAADDGVKI